MAWDEMRSHSFSSSEVASSDMNVGVVEVTYSLWELDFFPADARRIEVLPERGVPRCAVLEVHLLPELVLDDVDVQAELTRFFSMPRLDLPEFEWLV